MEHLQLLLTMPLCQHINKIRTCTLDGKCTHTPIPPINTHMCLLARIFPLANNPKQLFWYLPWLQVADVTDAC